MTLISIQKLVAGSHGMFLNAVGSQPCRLERAHSTKPVLWLPATRYGRA
jgi:hypothetical protein